MLHVVTAVVKWRDPLTKHFRPPLPEPPRYRHVSKVGRLAKDAMGRTLEDWLRDVAVSTTIDAD
jgi:hypothetical protein